MDRTLPLILVVAVAIVIFAISIQAARATSAGGGGGTGQSCDANTRPDCGTQYAMCDTSLGEWYCSGASATCGNGICSAAETSENCAEDCLIPMANGSTCDLTNGNHHCTLTNQDGVCVHCEPSCGAAGGNTCGGIYDWSVCQGHNLLNVWDCTYCCYVPAAQHACLERDRPGAHVTCTPHQISIGTCEPHDNDPCPTATPVAQCDQNTGQWVCVAVPAALSADTTSLSLAINETKTVTISGGTEPYSTQNMQTFDSSNFDVTKNGAIFSVKGKRASTSNLVIKDSSSPLQTVTIAVTVTSTSTCSFVPYTCSVGSYMNNLVQGGYCSESDITNCAAQSAKYRAGRVFSCFATPQITSAVLSALHTAGLSATQVDLDTIDFGPDGVWDVVRGANANGVGLGWQWIASSVTPTGCVVVGDTCTCPSGNTAACYDGTPVITGVSPTTVAQGATIIITGTKLTNVVQFFDSAGNRYSVTGTVNAARTITTARLPANIPIGAGRVRIYAASNHISNEKQITITGGAACSITGIVQPTHTWSPVQTLNGWYAHISPTGRYVAYGDYSDSWLTDLQTGTEKRFTTDFGPTGDATRVCWSGDWIAPDRLVIGCQDSDNGVPHGERWIFNINGSFYKTNDNPDYLLTNYGGSAQPDVGGSPDGDWGSTATPSHGVVYDNQVVAPDGGIAVGDGGWLLVTNTGNTQFSLLHNGTTVLSNYVSKAPLSWPTINHGYVLYAWAGKVYGRAPNGQEVDLTASPFGSEGDARVFFVDGQPWVSSLFNMGSPGYLFLRPWGDNSKLIMAQIQPAVGATVVKSGNQFIAATFNDKGHQEVYTIPAQATTTVNGNCISNCDPHNFAIASNMGMSSRLGQDVAYSRQDDLALAVWGDDSNYNGVTVTGGMTGQLIRTDGTLVGGNFLISNIDGDHMFSGSPHIAYDEEDDLYLVVWRQSMRVDGAWHTYGSLVAGNGTVVKRYFEIADSTCYVGSHASSLGNSADYSNATKKFYVICTHGNGNVGGDVQAFAVTRDGTVEPGIKITPGGPYNGGATVATGPTNMLLSWLSDDGIFSELVNYDWTVASQKIKVSSENTGPPATFYNTVRNEYDIFYGAWNTYKRTMKADGTMGTEKLIKTASAGFFGLNDITYSSRSDSYFIVGNDMYDYSDHMAELTSSGTLKAPVLVTSNDLYPNYIPAVGTLKNGKVIVIINTAGWPFAQITAGDGNCPGAVTPDPPTIKTITPQSGTIGTLVSIKGEEFTSGDVLAFGSLGAINLGGAGSVKNFIVPAKVCGPLANCSTYNKVLPGTYPLSVINQYGESNKVGFTVIPIWLNITANSTLNTVSGSNFLANFAVKGAVSNVVLSESGLPVGMSITRLSNETYSSQTFALTGTPAGVGTYSFSLVAEDENGDSGNASFALVVTSGSRTANLGELFSLSSGESVDINGTNATIYLRATGMTCQIIANASNITAGVCRGVSAQTCASGFYCDYRSAPASCTDCAGICRLIPQNNTGAFCQSYATVLGGLTTGAPSLSGQVINTGETLPFGTLGVKATLVATNTTGATLNVTAYAGTGNVFVSLRTDRRKYSINEPVSIYASALDSGNLSLRYLVSKPDSSVDNSAMQRIRYATAKGSSDFVGSFANTSASGDYSVDLNGSALLEYTSVQFAVMNMSVLASYIITDNTTNYLFTAADVMRQELGDSSVNLYIASYQGVDNVLAYVLEFNSGAEVQGGLDWIDANIGTGFTKSNTTINGRDLIVYTSEDTTAVVWTHDSYIIIITSTGSVPDELITAYLNRYESDLGSTQLQGNLTTQNVHDVISRLESLSTRLDSLQKTSAALADYYSATNNTAAAKYATAAERFGEARIMTNSIIAEINTNIANPAQISDRVRSDVRELKAYMRTILMGLLGTNGDINATATGIFGAI